MLPLHKSFKSFAFAFFSFIVLSSCSDNSKRDNRIIEALNESIENSNRSIKSETTEVLISLQSRLNETWSQERAKIWYSRAEKIQQLSKEIFDYLEHYKLNLKNASVNSLELFDKLKSYKEQILQVDEKITNQFHKTMKVYGLSIDSSRNDQYNLFTAYFKKSSNESILAVLTMLQNNIRLNENRMIIFCHDQTATHPLEYIPSPLLVQSSSVVKPNESIEITAGVVCFNTNSRLELYVNDKRIPLNSLGVGHCEITASSKSGVYNVPVKIDYTDYDGKHQTFKKQIEYTVASIQK